LKSKRWKEETGGSTLINHADSPSSMLSKWGKGRVVIRHRKTSKGKEGRHGSRCGEIRGGKEIEKKKKTIDGRKYRSLRPV